METFHDSVRKYPKKKLKIEENKNNTKNEESVSVLDYIKKIDVNVII